MEPYPIRPSVPRGRLAEGHRSGDGRNHISSTDVPEWRVLFHENNKHSDFALGGPVCYAGPLNKCIFSTTLWLGLGRFYRCGSPACCGQNNCTSSPPCFSPIQFIRSLPP